jgi:hypothetical protein
MELCAGQLHLIEEIQKAVGLEVRAVYKVVNQQYKTKTSFGLMNLLHVAR